MRKYLKDKNKQTSTFTIQARKQIQYRSSSRQQSLTKNYKKQQSSIYSNNYLQHVKPNMRSKREKISRNGYNVGDGCGSDDDMDQCTDENLNGEASIDESDLQKLSEVIKRLVLKNKLNAKNAFDVPLIDVTSMGAIKKNDDSAWSKISSVLENSSKVYSFRVDSIADSVNKMTNNISRSQKTHDLQFTDKIKSQRQKNQYDQLLLTNQLSSFAEQYPIDQKYTKHLQKQKINQNSNMNKSDVNPFHQSIRRMFDQNGISGLLLGRLNITSRLNIVVDVGIQYQLVRSQQSNKNQARIEAEKREKSNKISIFQEIGLFTNFCFPPQQPKQIVQDCANLKFQDQPDFYQFNDYNDLMPETMRDSQSYEQIDGKISEQAQNMTNFEKNINELQQIKQQNSLNVSKLSNFSIIMQPFEQNIQKRNNKKQKIKQQVKKQPKAKRQRVKKQDFLIDFKEQKTLDKKSIMSSNQSNIKKKLRTKQKNIMKKLIPQFNISVETNFAPIIKQQVHELSNFLSSHEQILYPITRQEYTSNNFTSMNSMQEGLYRIPNIKDTKKYLWQIIQKTAQTTISQLHQRYQRQKGIVSQTIIFLSVLHLGNEKNLLIKEGQNYQIQVKNPFIGE